MIFLVIQHISRKVQTQKVQFLHFTRFIRLILLLIDPNLSHRACRAYLTYCTYVIHSKSFETFRDFGLAIIPVDINLQPLHNGHIESRTHHKRDRLKSRLVYIVSRSYSVV